MEKIIKNKRTNGITLIALVITIIVLLILAGISITMLAGENSIIQKAGDAKTNTKNVQIEEKAKLAYTSALTNGEGTVTEQLFKDELDKEFGVNGYKLTTDEEKNEWVVKVDDIEKLRVSKGNTSLAKTLGEEYNDSWIGRKINYTSTNNNSTIQEADGWIILGRKINEQGKNDIIITTANPVSEQYIDCTLAGWCNYENTINTACSSYVGTSGKFGSKDAIVKEVRSIKLEDINYALGLEIPETFGDVNPAYYYPKEENGTWSWEKSASSDYKNDSYGYAYDYESGNLYYNSATKDGYRIESTKATNITYIANAPYWIANRGVDSNSSNLSSAYFYAGWQGYGYVSISGNELCYSDENGGHDGFGDGASRAIRPVVVLSSEISYDDVTIGDYFAYAGDIDF